MLEVVFALALFLFAVAVINSGLQAAANSMDRLKQNTHAIDLAISVMSQVQMGIIPMESVEGQPFLAPFDQWTYEIKTAEFGDSLQNQSRPTQVEVIVRHTTMPIVHRLFQVISPEGTNTVSTDMNDAGKSAIQEGSSE